MTDDQEIPTIKIGDREFAVPEFSGWAQRVVSPMLMKASKLAPSIEEEESFGKVLDAVYTALTIQTIDGKKTGKKVNDISKEDFEELRFKSLQMAQEILPTLLRQAGLIRKEDGKSNGKGGPAAPDSPLPGETTSTSEPLTSSSPHTEDGKISNDSLPRRSQQFTG